MRTAIAVALIGVGTVVFHIWSPWWSTEIASNWGFIDTTLDLTFWVTGVAFLCVVLFTAYCLYRFPYSKDRRADYEPENKKLEVWLTVITTVGVVILLAPGLIAWADFVNPPEDADEVEVLGTQWTWAYRFPGKDGTLGATHVRLVTDDNPFGIDPKDPKGRDDVLIDEDELHLPLDRPVKLLLRSLDVLHDFYVPQFRAKMDIVPGMVTFFWLTPTRTGTFDVLCAELCGTGHYAMRGKVVVEKEGDFNAWLADYSTFEKSMADAGKPLDDVARLTANAESADPPKKESVQ